jgi:hypothetical protein
MRKILNTVLLFLSLTAASQTSPFDLVLEPVNISNLGGLQSFAFGQANGKWLLIGGRLDGLHRRQPWASFDAAGHNNQLIVVDPLSLNHWTAALTSLPLAIQEQLSSTNMNFYQEGDYLYIIGGYGYSATLGDHTTYPNLTAIKVSDVITAIINNANLTPYFRQLTDPQFQVTGGRLRKINNVYHLLGGQKFTGRYNPMNNPTFTQNYTNQIRRFTLTDNGVNISINHLSAYTDTANLHRRDYNAEAQIMPNGEEGITMFSGVFQQNVDLPFLNSITVDSSGYSVNNAFQQYYNHYHCAAIPLFSSRNKEMHTVFFGGIAQYYDSSGVLIQDNNVPFVKTIARVSRDSNGTMAEYKLPIEMPAYLGAGSEFIPNKALSHFNNAVIELDSITADSTLLGYIFGGINSTAANIFWINTGTESSATPQIFKVYATNLTLSVHELNERSMGTLNLRVRPNPSSGQLQLNYYLEKKSEVKIALYDTSAKLVEEQILDNQKIGDNSFSFRPREVRESGIYFLELSTSYESLREKVILLK